MTRLPSTCHLPPGSPPLAGRRSLRPASVPSAATSRAAFQPHRLTCDTVAAPPQLIDKLAQTRRESRQQLLRQWKSIKNNTRLRPSARLAFFSLLVYHERGLSQTASDRRAGWAEPKHER